MKKYDGILIASDWDGTLSYESKISAKNAAAVRRFMDNGGKFTIVSGRYYSYLKSLTGDFYCNAPYITLNGAYIYDEKAGKVLYEKPIDGEALSLLDSLSRTGFFEKIVLFGTDGINISYTLSEWRRRDKKATLPSCYKLALISKRRLGTLLGSFASRFLRSERYSMVRTWNRCVEILLLENTKGVAAQRVKAVTGCHTLIAVGDYENDLSMFKVADLAVAVGDALPMVKRAADIVINNCEDDAIADLIDRLDDVLPKIKV